MLLNEPIKKATSWVFISLLLQTSCVVYKKTPISVEDLDNVKNNKVKLETRTGDVVKAKWTNVLEDSIVVIEKPNINRIHIKHIQHISYYGPEYKIVDIERALNYEGNILVETNKKKYVFFDIKKEYAIF